MEPRLRGAKGKKSTKEAMETSGKQEKLREDYWIISGHTIQINKAKEKSPPKLSTTSYWQSCRATGPLPHCCWECKCI